MYATHYFISPQQVLYLVTDPENSLSMILLDDALQRRTEWRHIKSRFSIQHSPQVCLESEWDSQVHV